MRGEPWGGRVADDAEAFAAEAAQLYSDRASWEAAQARGRALLAELYPREANLAAVRQAIETARTQLAAHRAQDYAGAMLWHQTARSTEYFSRWIELKEAAAAAAREEAADRS